MTRKALVLLLLLFLSVITIVAVAAWFGFHDSGVVAAVALGVIYIMLLSFDLPIEGWMRVPAVRLIVKEGSYEVVFLNDPCPFGDYGTKRHVHFCEVLERTSSERLACLHGAVKLSEKLAEDIRDEWEHGIKIALGLFVLWGVLTFGTAGHGGGSAAVAPALESGFGWKTGITVLVGFYKLASNANIIHWFRKQNALR